MTLKCLLLLYKFQPKHPSGAGVCHWHFITWIARRLPSLHNAQGEKQWSQRNSSARCRIRSHLTFLISISSWVFCGFIFCMQKVWNCSKYQHLRYSAADPASPSPEQRCPADGARWSQTQPLPPPSRSSALSSTVLFSQHNACKLW